MPVYLMGSNPLHLNLIEGTLQAAGWQGRFILRGVDNTHLLHATVPQLRRDQGLDAHTLAQDVLTRN